MTLELPKDSVALTNAATRLLKASALGKAEC
jgi:hypothetical protein